MSQPLQALKDSEVDNLVRHLAMLRGIDRAQRWTTATPLAERVRFLLSEAGIPDDSSNADERMKRLRAWAVSRGVVAHEDLSAAAQNHAGPVTP